jgi:TRAP-type C4-dicarboxylate transport system permease small subunit
LAWLDKLARACAVLAGVLLALITLLTCASVVGRNLLDTAMAGDFELTSAATGIAVALCLPWCQLRHGNITVDFFTDRASSRTVAKLNRLACFLVATAMAVLTWRTTMGCVSAWNSHSGSMLLGFPDWAVYAGMVPPMLLTGAIAMWQAVQGPATRTDGLPL